MPMIDVDLPEGFVPVAAHARLAGDLHVLLREAAEGGWGVSGSAFGREEFAALRAGAAGAAAATP